MPAISFLPFLQTVPWGTRCLVVLLVVATALNAGLAQFFPAQPNQHGLPWLVMMPMESWKFPWTLLLSGFVELHVIELVISLVTVGLGCRYLERLWGFRELLMFTAVVIVGSNVIAFGFAWLAYLIVGMKIAITGVPYHGLSGLQSGLLVAFTQIMPENQIQLFGVLRARVKTVPGVFLLVSNVLVILLGPSPFILIQFGFFVAWIYLRFFKLSETGEYRGDRSEAFAFQYWLPSFVRPIVNPVFDAIFRLAVRLGVISGWEESGTSYGPLPGPGSTRAEADRRRQLALRALDARLAASTPTAAVPDDNGLDVERPVAATPSPSSAS